MPAFTTRPVVMSARGVVTSGHYLVSSVGLQMLMRGGNAIDAAAAMGICETLLEPQSCGIGGEVPTLVYIAKEQRTYAVSGMGWSAEGIHHRVVPAERHRPHPRRRLPARLRPRRSRHMDDSPRTLGHHELRRSRSAHHRPRRKRLPPIRRPPPAPDRRLRQVHRALPHHRRDILPQRQRAPDRRDYPQPRLRRDAPLPLRRRAAGKGQRPRRRHRSRLRRILQGRRRGEDIRFIHDNPVEDASGMAHKGLLEYEDLAEWHATVEQPVSLEYDGLDVHKCPSWTQGSRSSSSSSQS